MRILHLEAGRRLYGGGRQVLYLLEGLARRGVENLLVCEAEAGIATEARPFAQVLPLPLSDLRPDLLWRLWRLLRRTRPDLVHLHSRRADLQAALAARLCGIPCLITRRVDNPEPIWMPVA